MHPFWSTQKKIPQKAQKEPEGTEKNINKINFVPYVLFCAFCGVFPSALHEKLANYGYRNSIMKKSAVAEESDDAVDALVGRFIGRAEDEFRIFGSFVGRADSGEIADFAAAGFGVEPFGIAGFADIKWTIDIDLNKSTRRKKRAHASAIRAKG